MKKVYAMLLCSYLALLIVNSCKDCPNPAQNTPPVDTTKPKDPCEGRTTAFKASFTIYEGSGLCDTVMVSDTVLNRNIGIFKADGDYTSYEWQIGTDARTWNTKQVRLTFSNNDVGAIRIRLIARDTNYIKCVAGDDGIDTVFKTLVLQRRSATRMLGKFRGANLDNPLDSFTVDFSMIREGNINNKDTTNRVVMVNNLPKGAFEPDIVDGIFAYCNIFTVTYYKGVNMETNGSVGNGVNGIRGFAKLSEDASTITIHYTEFDRPSTNPRIKRTFIGKRIP